MLLGVEKKDVLGSTVNATGLVLLNVGSEIFPGDVLGSKVISEVEKLVRVEDTMVANEVCVWAEEFMVPGTGVIPEVDANLTVVSEMDAVAPLLF